MPKQKQKTSDLPPLTRANAAKAADRIQAGTIRQIGVELMDAFNKGKRDPTTMAKIGHDTAHGYEFCIERNGSVFTVTITRDWE